MFKPKHISTVLALAVLFLTLWAAAAPAQNWDYLRPPGTIGGAKTTDSLMCWGGGGTVKYDTSKIFYFNNLIPKGLVFVKVCNKNADSVGIRLPRLDYCLISEPTGANGTYIGKYRYKINDTLDFHTLGVGDSSAIVRYKHAVSDTTEGLTTTQTRKWTCFVDSIKLATITAADTIARAFPYDFSKYPGIYAIQWRGSISAVTACSTKVKSIYMTGTLPSKFLLQP